MYHILTNLQMLIQKLEKNKNMSAEDKAKIMEVCAGYFLFCTKCMYLVLIYTVETT